MPTLILKAIVFTVLVPGSFLGWIPHLLARWWPVPIPLGPLRWLGLPLILIGVGTLLVCVFDFAMIGRGTPLPLDPPKNLVRARLFEKVRNPMYLGVLTACLGEAVFLEKAVIFLQALVMAVGAHLFVVFYEEPTLRKKFGSVYEEYMRKVPRWIPKLD